MATMHPPALRDADVKSDAERRVFAALRDRLPDEWLVFHSASLVLRDADAGGYDDEVDFVLVHPARGVIALEVKGGGIECNHGAWYGIHAGVRERIPDPFAQTIDHKHNLRRAIDAAGGHAIAIGHATWFADITVHQLVLAPDAPAELVLDRHDLERPAGAVERVVRWWSGRRDGRHAPGEDGVRLIKDLLAPEVSIRVPMAASFAGEAEQLVELTQEQAALLTRFKRTKRLAVHGCAGSGKTMLAVERAKQLAADGKQVLFVCFNKALSQHLRHVEGGSGIQFFTFHGLCRHWAGRAGVELSKADPPPQSFWDEELPAALMTAMDAEGPQYDAVFADEAQDLHNDWLDALETTLHPGGLLWLFLDDNQRVYDQRLTVPEHFATWDLTVNCRNTQAIHAEVMKLYEGEIRPDVRGPAGRPIELHRATDQAELVTGVLARLCADEEIPPQDVAVLSSHAEAKSTVAPAVARHFPRTRFSSIRSFKGLEAPVVVLCELEDLDDATRDQQLYVALSRARHHCVVVVPG